MTHLMRLISISFLFSSHAMAGNNNGYVASSSFRLDDGAAPLSHIYYNDGWLSAYYESLRTAYSLNAEQIKPVDLSHIQTRTFNGTNRIFGSLISRQALGDKHIASRSPSATSAGKVVNVKAAEHGSEPNTLPSGPSATSNENISPGGAETVDFLKPKTLSNKTTDQ